MKSSVRKILCGCLSVATLSVGLFAFGTLSACKDDETSSSQQTTETEYTLSLTEYATTLYVGETYTLQPKKLNNAGAEESIQTLSYTVEYGYVASCENGTVTALAAGETAVYITADGLNVAFFVEVKDELRENEASISFMEEQLYVGISSQASLYKMVAGEMQRIEAAMWTVEDETALTVTSDGLVTPLKETENAVLKATYTENGVSREVQTTVRAVEPVLYETSVTKQVLATTKTYAGAENTKYTSATFTVHKRNALTGEKTQLTKEAFTIAENAAFKTEVAADGTVTVKSNAATATTQALLLDFGAGKKATLTVDVYNAISTVADMDALSFASYNNSGDLSKSYLLVNDIDYAGETLYPIALWKNNANRRVGVQWKYLLQYDATAKTYSYLPRTDVANTEKCLTDEQFVAFAKTGGINPKNVEFTGTFDGNGYTVKNAKIMYAPFIVSEQNVYSAETGVFGRTNQATIRNAKWELSMQTPDELAAKTGQTLHRAYIGGTLVDVSMQKKGETDNYAYWSSCFIPRAMETTIENVFVELTLTDTLQNVNNSGGVIVGWANDMKMQNVVAVVVNDAHNEYYGLTESGSASKVLKNNLCLGVTKQAARELSAKECGENGNWWTNKTQWSDMLALQQGVDVSNPVSLTDVIASFDTTIWDVSGLSANVAPTLLNGCSV